MIQHREQTIEREKRKCFFKKIIMYEGSIIGSTANHSEPKDVSTGGLDVKNI